MELYFNCSNCDKVLSAEERMVCVKCKSESYCSTKCRKAHLFKHKKNCVKKNVKDKDFYTWVNNAIEDNMHNLFSCSLSNYKQRGRGCVFFDVNGNTMYYPKTLIEEEFKTRMGTKVYKNIKKLLENYDPEKDMITGYIDIKNSTYSVHHISLEALEEEEEAEG